MNRIDRFKTATTALLVITLAGTSHGWLSPRNRPSRIAATRSAAQSCRPACGDRGRRIRSMSRAGHPEGSRLRDRGAQRRQWPRQRRGPGAQGTSEPVATARPAAPVAFVAPPRTIADITAILDSEKPDPQKIEKIRAAADAQPPGGSSRDKLARFYYERGNARASLGRLSDAIADANKALETGRGAVELNLLGRLHAVCRAAIFRGGRSQACAGDFRCARAREMDGPGAKGYQFDSNRQIASIYLQMGDVAQAEAYLRRNMALIVEARTSGLPGWRASYPGLGQNWEAIVESHRAMIFEARGQFRDAEASYPARRAASARRDSSHSCMSTQESAARKPDLADRRIFSRMGQGAHEGAAGPSCRGGGRCAPRAAVAASRRSGKYHPMTPRFIMGLADVLVEQGRYAEAEKLARVSLEINRTIGIAARCAYHCAIAFQSRRHAEPAAQVRPRRWRCSASSTRSSPNGSRTAGRCSRSTARASIRSTPAARSMPGIAAAQALLKREIGRVGERHFDTASARGTLAIGLMKAGKDAEAAREFRTAIPVLMASARENADDDDTTRGRSQEQPAAEHRRGLYRAARPAARRRRCRGRNLRARRRDPRPLGAAGAGGFQRAYACEGSGARRASSGRSRIW